MRMFDDRCPVCGSRDWESVEKDENRINRVIQCLECLTRRERHTEPEWTQ